MIVDLNKQLLGPINDGVQFLNIVVSVKIFKCGIGNWLCYISNGILFAFQGLLYCNILHFFEKLTRFLLGPCLL